MITWSAHLSTLYRHLPVSDRPVAAAAAGARVVETWWVGHLDHHAWCEAIRARGLQGLQLVPELMTAYSPANPAPTTRTSVMRLSFAPRWCAPMIFSHCGSR